MPSRANTNATSPSRICLRNFCRIRASRSGSSSTTRMVAVMRLAQAWYRFRGGAARNRSAWSKADRATFDRLAPGFDIAIRGDHDDGNVGPLRTHLRQHLEPAHAGHVDVGQDQDQRRVGNVRGAGKCCRRRRDEFHREASGAQVAPKLLTEQGFDIGLVIDDEDVNAQFETPVCACAAAVRGSVIMNSVNTPGIVSTSILPPCCFTTMSWLIDRPSPVPSPAGLVVKNGLNIFSFTSNGIPVPLSRIRISTLLPRLFVVALSVGSKLFSPVSLRLVAA